MRKKWILLAENDAHYADQALRLLAAGYEPPAVVLLDLNMPKVHGWEVLRQIKNDPRLTTIPIVVFTSSTEASDCYRSYQLGANAYVVKPANLRQFAAALEGVRQFWLAVNEL